MKVFKDKSCISPIKMNNDSIFRFECHSKVKCFTMCCKGINITLTPYDIIQLKNRLNMSSRDFLSFYTKPYLLEKTDLPMVTLRLLDDKDKTCPFLKYTDEYKGCIIYKDRPTACRYYPLGIALFPYENNDENNRFFFFVNEDHCEGFKERKKWSVKEWKKNQDVYIRDDANLKWMDIIIRKRSFPSNINLLKQAKHMFFLASYDIDKFREFVFDSSFLKHYSVDENVLSILKEDEIKLLDFGLSWLKDVFFCKKK